MLWSGLRLFEGVIQRVNVNRWHDDILRAVEYRDVRPSLCVELYGRNGVVSSYCLPHCRCQNLPYGALVLEFYLCLSGVNVDVYEVGLDIEVYEVWHLLALRHKSLVCRHDSLVERGMAHIASVDEEVLLDVLLMSRLRFAHESVDIAQ